MSVFTTQPTFRVLIGKSVSRTASVQITDPTATSTYIADGEIVVLDYATGLELTPGDTITEAPVIQVVQRSGNKLVYSGPISGQFVRHFDGKDGVAAQEQITFVGFNGTSGEIDTTAESRLFKITYTYDYQMWSEQLKTRIYQHKGTTPTQAEIAESIARQINLDEATNVKTEILLDAAADVLAGGSNLSVFNGSAVVLTTADETANIAAGDYLRIGAEDTVTVGVYLVTAVTATTITLSMPYQGATATVLNANTGNIDAAVADAADAGIKLTGLALKFDKAYYSYLKVTFLVGTPTDGWGSTLVTNSQTANPGTGVFEQVASLEWFALGEEGALNRTVVPLPEGRSDATSGALYDAISIVYSDQSDTNHPVSGVKPSGQHLYIFIVDGASQETDILAQLNPWMASTPQAFATITL